MPAIWRHREVHAPIEHWNQSRYIPAASPGTSRVCNNTRALRCGTPRSLQTSPQNKRSLATASACGTVVLYRMQQAPQIPLLPPLLLLPILPLLLLLLLVLRLRLLLCYTAALPLYHRYTSLLLLLLRLPSGELEGAKLSNATIPRDRTSSNFRMACLPPKKAYNFH